MKVWITRTNPGASQLAKRLTEAGVDSLVKPVLQIEPTHSEPPRESFDEVIFISVHAANLGKSHFQKKTNWYAVGAATARALQKTGVQLPASDNETNEGLLELPGLQEGNGRRVLLVCGEGGRKKLQDTLRERGFKVQRFEAYRRIAQKVDELPQAEIIVVGSSQGMQVVANEWLKRGRCQDVAIVVPSLRVAEIGRSLGFKNVHNSAGAAIEETFTCVLNLVKCHD